VLVAVDAGVWAAVQMDAADAGKGNAKSRTHSATGMMGLIGLPP
jgi:hypothetical protein